MHGLIHGIRVVDRVKDAYSPVTDLHFAASDEGGQNGHTNKKRKTKKFNGTRGQPAPRRTWT